MFGLFHDNDLVGMTGIVCHKDDPEKAALIASYIRPEHRGKGLSSLLYEARLDWAKANRIKAVTVSHRISNMPSMAANQRFGFRYTHAKSKLWPDGVEADEVFYVLDLRQD